MKRARGQHGASHPWTPEQSALLIREWGELSSRGLREKLSPHSWIAIRARAKRLGLPMGVPQGRATVHRMEELFGFDEKTIRALLERAGLAARLSYPSQGRPPRSPWRHYDLEEARAIIEQHLRAETTTEAAARLGLHANTMRQRARRAGLVTQRARVRLPPETWNQLAANSDAHGDARRGVAA
jgi:hypothetical protein